MHPDKSADWTTQMKVCHAQKQAGGQCENTTAHTPPPVNVAGVGPTQTTAVSTLTNKSGEVGEVMVRGPKLKLTRMTAAAKQQQLTNKLSMESHYLAALKKATSVHAKEKRRLLMGFVLENQHTKLLKKSINNLMDMDQMPVQFARRRMEQIV